MQVKRGVLEQHIAVFGESGSGKTVMVSSFYGATQEAQFLKSSLFDVTADDTGQGHRLHANYLGMKESGRRPETTRFSSTPYAFSVSLRYGTAKANSRKPFDALRLVWHDYPGDWFEQEVTGPEVAQRRVATFKSLLSSDVALLLVDGQRLLDNAGEEERYLKSLLGSFRTGLLRLRDQLLEDGKPLVRFPRIWILALSKADLLPELDVFGFRDLVIGAASDDLGELRKVLQGLVDSPDALAVGEDFLRISSAKFEPNRIEVTERIGLDLILPVAAMLPLERLIKWVQRKQIPAKVAEELGDGFGALVVALIGKNRFVKERLEKRFGRKAVNAAMRAAANLVPDQLRKMNLDARAKQDYMTEVLTSFGLDLEEGEKDGILLRSRR
ncbi:MAG: ATP/GTP-binding protein [Actinomycetota bacterium]|nr:ATP/GTP-binding protein [Actinomycetota bacterium]